MSQYDFGAINPATTSGAALASLLGQFRDAQNSSHKGAGRPSYSVPGMFWIKENGTMWEFYVFDGTDDVLLITVDTDTGAVTTPNFNPDLYLNVAGGTVSGAVTFDQDAAGADVLKFARGGIEYALNLHSEGYFQFNRNGVLVARIETAFDDVPLQKSLLTTTMADARYARRFTSGQALPGTDVGPIWHDDYNSMMTWQVFNANGANYTGYASAYIGQIVPENGSTPRAGHVGGNGQVLSDATYAALKAWAQHNGKFVALGAWTAGADVYADNGDGTFRGPDVRAQFMRFFDDGAGIDAGRTRFTSQGDQVGPHRHPVHHYQNHSPFGVGGSGSIDGYVNTTGASNLPFDLSGDPATGNTGTETRVRNFDVLATIKF